MMFDRSAKYYDAIYGSVGSDYAADADRVRATIVATKQSRGDRLLDVACGTGGHIEHLKRHYEVEGADISPAMLDIASRRNPDVTFHLADMTHLQLGTTFDAVICLRMLMHVPDWRKALAELCRVTRERLVIDYPALTSTAALQAVWRRAASTMGSRVEAYRVFSNSAIAREMRRSGFQIVSRHKQFVVPIALHKAVGSESFTRGLERTLAHVGLLKLAGSPVTIAAERCAS